jgi:tetratricopeptide (TPR) repeat protein
MGRPAEALGPMSRAVSLEPAKNLYRNNVAAALVELQRDDEALEHLAAVHPPAQAEYNVAFLLFKQGRKDQALVHFENAARLDPSLMQAREWVARLRGGSFAQNSPVRRTSLEQQSVNPQIASSRAAMQLSPATTNHSVAPAPASQAVRPNVAAQASSPYANYGAAPRQEFLEVAALAPSPSRSTSPPPLVTSPLRLPESSPQRSSAEDAPAPR